MRHYPTPVPAPKNNAAQKQGTVGPRLDVSQVR